ncbi:MAG TPA: hypothetical protein VFF73_20045 [Planctomycetota bacterium]|nr:hypothetical protein [Planctomycetota bacterium]
MPAPRFPVPSGSLYEKRDADRAEELLRRTEEWRVSALAWLRSPESVAVSDELRAFLEHLLRGEKPATVVPASYGLTPYPAGGTALERAVSVLRWRSAVTSFLSDVWDVIGEPLFDLEECQKALEAFAPEGPAGARCAACLLEVEASKRLEHARVCPLRR